jgi:hypothetical protein
VGGLEAEGSEEEEGGSVEGRERGLAVEEGV